MVVDFFGLPGSGKTTLLTKFACDEIFRINSGISKYKYVYTNANIKVPGVRIIKWSYLGVYDYKDCLILIDEIGLNAHSRDFTSFPKHLVEWFCTHRHEGCDIYYFSQYYNQADKVIREVTEKTYYLQKCKIFRWRSKYTLIPKAILIPPETGEIKEGYRMPNFIERIWLRRSFSRSPYYKYFDSWESVRTRPPAKYVQIPPSLSRLSLLIRKLLRKPQL